MGWKEWAKGYRKGVEDAKNGTEEHQEDNDKTWDNRGARRSESFEESKYRQGYNEGQQDYYDGDADID